MQQMSGSLCLTRMFIAEVGKDESGNRVFGYSGARETGELGSSGIYPTRVSESDPKYPRIGFCRVRYSGSWLSSAGLLGCSGTGKRFFGRI